MEFQKPFVASLIIHAGILFMFAAAQQRLNAIDLPLFVNFVSEPGAAVSGGVPKRLAEPLPDPPIRPAAASEEAAVPDEAAPPPTESPAVESPPPPAAQAPSRSLAAYHRYVLFHASLLSEKAGRSVQSFLDSRRPLLLAEELSAASAEVELRYGRNGTLEEVEVFTASGALASLLEQLDWSTVPSPASYALPFSRQRIRVSITDGVPAVAAFL